MNQDVNFSKLYNEHNEYVQRRKSDTFERRRIELEVDLFKIPNILNIIGDTEKISTIVEIGCATGDLVGRLSLSRNCKKIGVDISDLNIAAAKIMYPDVQFMAGNFRSLDIPKADVVILSDILEHVPDDVQFLQDASKLATLTVINLPIEDCIHNKFRKYGPNDPSGHLRKYSISAALNLCREARVSVLRYNQKWSYLSAAETAIRNERYKSTGKYLNGSLAIRILKSAALICFHKIPKIGKEFYASSFFAVVSPLK